MFSRWQQKANSADRQQRMLTPSWNLKLSPIFAEFRVYHATFSPCYHQISLPLFSLLNTYCHRFYWKKKLNYRSCIATENKCMVLYKVCLFTITWKIFKAWHQKSDANIPIVSARRTKKCSFSSIYNIMDFFTKKVLKIIGQFLFEEHLH